MTALRAMVGVFSNVYLVFDALDEYSERDELLGVLGLIHGWEIDTLHLLATSRREPEIEDGLNRLVTHRVPMEEILVADDIQMHVVRILDEDVKLQSYSEGKKVLIETTLTEGAHGM